MAGLEEASAVDQLKDLLSRSLVTQLDPDPPRYCLHDLVRGTVEASSWGGAEPRETWPRRHAQVLCRYTAGNALDALPDLRQALHWALSQHDDEAWVLACALARRAFALTRGDGRLAEPDELMQMPFRAAQQREDQHVLADCAWERMWILEKWDRLEEAWQLDHYRRTVSQDQRCFDFMLDRPHLPGAFTAPVNV